MARIMALDVGSRRIGVAVSDETGLVARPVATIARGAPADVEEIRSLAERLGVGEVVVGLPRNMNGTLGPQAEAVMEFVAELRQHLGLPVHLWDERLTTREAEATLAALELPRRRRKDVVDQVAAVLILQGFLERRRGRSLD